eukprot:GEMP01070984.1.p1 GENE.GEMP01070984.1~~GEMP01070984.1.p1  ORF type:complete len:217 (+),score=29.59 GEMP01070984.1:183-833(+)
MYRTVTARAARMIVAVDVDEVLGRYLSNYIEFVNNQYSMTLKFSDFHSYTFEEVINRSPEQTEETVRGFHESPYFEDLQLVPGSQEALKELQELGVEFHVVTSRQQAIEKTTQEWVNKHYSGIFSCVHVLNHFGGDGLRGPPKFVKCAEIGASLLIDDSLSNCMGMAESGKRALLLDLGGTYGWNKAESLPDSIKRVHSWSEIVSEVKNVMKPSSG